MDASTAVADIVHDGCRGQSRDPGPQRSFGRRGKFLASRDQVGAAWSSGTTTVNAASPFHPSTSAPQSIDTMSPAAMRIPLGTPCTTASLIEVHRVWW